MTQQLLFLMTKVVQPAKENITINNGNEIMNPVIASTKVGFFIVGDGRCVKEKCVVGSSLLFV